MISNNLSLQGLDPKRLTLAGAGVTANQSTPYSTLSPSISGGTMQNATSSVIPKTIAAPTPVAPVGSPTSGALSSSDLAALQKAQSALGLQGSLNQQTGQFTSSAPAAPVKGLVSPTLAPQTQQIQSQTMVGKTPEQIAQETGQVQQPIQPQTPPTQPNTQPDMSRGGITQGLIGYAQGTDPYYKEMQDIRKKISDIGVEEQRREGAINSEGIPLWSSQGRNSILRSAAVGQQNALTGQLNALQAARGQGESAQASAAGLAQPVTGIPLGTGSMTYDKNGQPVMNSGSPFQAGQVSGEQALGQQYAQNVSANNQAVAVKNQIVNFLNTTPINPSDFTDLNSVVGLLSGKVSDPKYQQLASQLNEYLQTITPILGVGGDSTDYKAGLAQSMLNARMSPEAIVQQLNTLSQTAATKLEQQKLGGGTQLPGQQTQSGALTWDNI